MLGSITPIVCLWAIIMMATGIGCAALVAAVWNVAADQWLGRVARRVRAVRTLAPGTENRGEDVASLLLREPLPCDPYPEKATWLDTARRRLPGLSLLLVQANLRWTPRAFALASGVCAVVGAGAAVALGAPVVAGLVMIAMASALPLAWVMFCRRRCIQKLLEQIPEGFDALANALRAGHSLPVAFHDAADLARRPLCDEFHRLSEAMNLGQDVHKALDDLVRRAPNPDIEFFAAAMKMQHREGGNSIEVLEIVSRAVRERLRLMRQIRALSAEGRLSGLVLSALPFLIFGMIYHLVPDYVMVLLQDPLGKKLLWATAGLQAVGIAAIQHIVSVRT